MMEEFLNQTPGWYLMLCTGIVTLLILGTLAMLLAEGVDRMDKYFKDYKEFRQYKESDMYEKFKDFIEENNRDKVT